MVYVGRTSSNKRGRFRRKAGSGSNTIHSRHRLVGKEQEEELTSGRTKDGEVQSSSLPNRVHSTVQSGMRVGEQGKNQVGWNVVCCLLLGS